MNDWDPYTELVTHANLLRQHERHIQNLLVHDSHMTRDYHRMQKQIINLLDIVEEQGKHIDMLLRQVEYLTKNDIK